MINKKDGKTRGKEMRKVLFVLFFVSIIGGVSAANVSFFPSSQVVGVNDQFDVNVTVTNFTDLYSYQFDVTYNSTVLQYIGISMGPFLTSDGGNALNLTPNTTVPGLIKNYAATRFGTTQGVSGNGIIAKITFRGLAIGNSNLVMLNDLFYDSNETNPQEISRTKLSGSVSVVNCDVDGDTYRSLACGGTDCNDNNALEFPGQTWYRDGDRDRYTNGTTQIICARPSGYNVTAELLVGTDCNDLNASINPGATEICDGVDNNCASGVDDIFTAETCSFVCTSLGFNFNISRVSPLTCCGNNLNEDSPYQTYGNETSCSDLSDNDCNGQIDMADRSCVLLKYDVTKDGSVNIADIQMAGNPLWFGNNACNALNTWCGGRDVNQNGFLNIQDLSLIGMHFT